MSDNNRTYESRMCVFVRTSVTLYLLQSFGIFLRYVCFEGPWGPWGCLCVPWWCLCWSMRFCYISAPVGSFVPHSSLQRRRRWMKTQSTTRWPAEQIFLVRGRRKVDLGHVFLCCAKIWFWGGMGVREGIRLMSTDLSGNQTARSHHMFKKHCIHQNCWVRNTIKSTEEIALHPPGFVFQFLFNGCLRVVAGDLFLRVDRFLGICFFGGHWG